MSQAITPETPGTLLYLLGDLTVLLQVFCRGFVFVSTDFASSFDGSKMLVPKAL
jgi:hypothetical protein